MSSVTDGHDGSVPRFSVARYQKMIETGVLDVNDRVELLENNLVLKSARNPRHDNAVDRIAEILYPLKPAG